MNMNTGRRFIAQLNSDYPEEAWRMLDSLCKEGAHDKTKSTLQHACAFALVTALDQQDYNTAYRIFSCMGERYYASMGDTPLTGTDTNPVAFDFKALVQSASSRNQSICAGILLKGGTEPSTETFNNLVALFSTGEIYGDKAPAEDG